MIYLLFKFIVTAENEYAHLDYEFTDDDIKELSSVYQNSIEKSELCLDTYVELEKGDIYYDGRVIAIDIGGSFIKIGIFDKIFDDAKIHVKSIPREKKTSYTDIFDFIVEELMYFIEYYKIDLHDEYQIALIFGYPVKLKNLNEGYLRSFCKDFPFKEYINNEKIDPLKILNEKLLVKEVNMRATVILNNTTATFAAAISKNYKCNLSVILGAGANGAFLLNNKIINSEWGHFDDDCLRKNALDRIIKYCIKKDQYACIDCMIGGLALNKMLYAIFNNSNDILKLYYQNKLDDLKESIVKKIKYRTYSILAVLTVVSVKGNSYHISIEGTGLKNEKDKELFQKMIKKIHCLIKKTEINVLKLISIDNAALRGAIHVLRYNGKIGNIN